MFSSFLGRPISTVAVLLAAFAMPLVPASAAPRTPPTVTSVSPQLGALSGGTKITVVGTGFTDLYAVLVGNIRAHKVQVLSPTKLTAAAPAHAAGRVDVQIRTAHGTSSPVAADHYSYVPAPTVTKVRLVKGNGLRGSVVRVKGHHLDGALTVRFGTRAGHILANTASKLDATVPAHHAGRLHVTVRTPGGTSSTQPDDVYPMPQPVAQKWKQEGDLGVSKGLLADVSCPTVTTCYAIDLRDQVWTITNGAWSDPVSLNHGDAWPEQISCPSVDFCAVAGTQYVFVLQDGTWTVGPKISRGGDPTGVSCPAVDHCVAVRGDHYTILSGGTWSTMADAPTDIAAIDCYDDMHCIATAQAYGGSGAAYRFDGTDWTLMPSYSDYWAAYHLSCASSTLCAADDGQRVLSWDGSSWSQPTAVDPDSPEYQTAVKCVAGTCVYDSGNSIYTFSNGQWTQGPSTATYHVAGCAAPTSCIGEDNLGHIGRYDGSSWHATSTQLGEVGPASSMDCPSSTFCAMADENGNAYTFDGDSWSSPHRITDTFYKPAAVSCPTIAFCLAVYGDGSTARWNGSKWVDAPDPEAVETALSCTSSTMCVAVGPHDTELYTGSSWSVVDSGTKRLAVSCGSKSFCVGVTTDGVQTFDGDHWHDAVADDSIWNVDAHSVSCPTADFCLVVDGIGRQIVYRDGDWSDPLPTLAVGPMTISCYSDSFCQVHGMGYSQSYDGHYWSAINRSGALDEIDDLTALSCYGVLTCRAADMTRVFASQPG